MNCKYATEHYRSELVLDHVGGSAAMVLYRRNDSELLYGARNGEESRVAEVIFWDACGQFFVETFSTDVPLDIMETLIAEAKQAIKVD